MAQLMVDSSVFIDLERSGRQPGVLTEAFENDSFFMAAITVSELLEGVYRANSERRRQQRQAFVDGVIRDIDVVPFDLAAARHHANIMDQLRRAGQTITANDVLIAATALAYGFTVLTGDLDDFPRVPGLIVQAFSL